jgi:leader peptidase (prepilin peptidase)/N-methyltransferase
MASVGALLGWFVPALIARIPEPPAPALADTGEEQGAVGEEHGAAGSPRRPSGAFGDGAHAEPKEPYAAIAALPGLKPRCSLVGGLVAGLVGARLGWDWAVLPLLYLVPVGVALAVVDWRTRLLPTRVIAPSYAVVAMLALLAAALAGDWGAALRALAGWAVAGGTFFVLWFVHPRGMGYGDVRLSGVLGIALGFLGWAELLTGVYAGFLLGGVGGLLLSALRIVDRKGYPFGPFMLAGAVVGVLAGPYVAAWYA